MSLIETDYASLPPERQHAVLRKIWRMLPPPPYQEYTEAAWSKLQVVCEAGERAFETGDFYTANAIIEADPRSHVDLEKLKREAEKRKAARPNSEYKGRIVEEVRKLVSLAPTTDSFQRFVVVFFDDSYDKGAGRIYNNIQRAILVHNARDGGFFNPRYARIEIYAYQVESQGVNALYSGPSLGELFNQLTEAISGGTAHFEDPVLVRARRDEERQDPKNLARLDLLHRWRPQIIEKYGIEPEGLC